MVGNRYIKDTIIYMVLEVTETEVKQNSFGSILRV